jgi:ABC-type polysaccharide/polyol phosphate transport system ATPase subunit
VKTAIQSSVGEAALQPGREGELFEANRSTQRVISFEGVSKSYLRNAGRGLLRNRLVAWLKRSPLETLRALDDISFEVREGESLAVVGANGAGKSTLLRLATGISMPDSGSVTVHGTIAALMELGAGFHPDLTGAENLVLNASLLGLSRKRTYEEFDSILEFSGIADFINEPLRTYSSGMVLRLAFSVAVRVNPDVLFLDEVLAVGDQEFRGKCIEEIKRLKHAGKTLVYVSHQTELTRELCDVALWLEHGKLKMFGPAATVLDSYEAGRTTKKPDRTQK